MKTSLPFFNKHSRLETGITFEKLEKRKHSENVKNTLAMKSTRNVKPIIYDKEENIAVRKFSRNTFQNSVSKVMFKSAQYNPILFPIPQNNITKKLGISNIQEMNTQKLGSKMLQNSFSKLTPSINTNNFFKNSFKEQYNSLLNESIINFPTKSFIADNENAILKDKIKMRNHQILRLKKKYF